jgi:hypothetical protein
MKNFILLVSFVFMLLSVNAQCNQYQIYESFGVSALPTQGGTWTQNSISYSGVTRTGSNSLRFNGANDWIRTPQIANPGVLTFWYRRSSNSTAWTLRIQTSPDGVTWTNRGSITSLTTTYQQYTLDIGALGLTNVFIRLLDDRGSGSHERYVDDLGITSTDVNENLLIPFLNNCSQTLTSSLTYTITEIGGPSDNYNNNLNQTVTLSPSDNTQKLQLSFTEFNLESNYDFLYVYDGSNTSSPLLATLTGTNIPNIITATNVSGQLTLRFTSDGSVNRPGFQATITSVTPCVIPTLGGTLSSNKDSTTTNDVITLTTSGNEGNITLLEYSFDNFSTITGSFTNPANPINITLSTQQPIIFFRTTSINGSCPIGLSNVVEVAISGSVIFTVGVTDGDYITNVTLNNINNESTNDGDAFQDFTHLVIELTRGEEYTLFVTATNTFQQGQGYAAWIDWNKDGIFQIEENILQKSPANTTSQTFAVPLDAVIGSVRLRVLSVWGTTPSLDAYTTTNYTWGEIEEYTVNISEPSTLPITLTSFTTDCNNGIPLLEWTTASEQNSDYFQIERSRDGFEWVIVSKIQAMGNSSSNKDYQFIDMTTGGYFEGYYRLKQVDFDGKFEYFVPKYILCTSNKTNYDIEIFPNPVKEELFTGIRNSMLCDGLVTIADFSGKVVKQEKINLLEGYNLINIDVKDLLSGIYLIKITSNDVQFVGRFIKN